MHHEGEGTFFDSPAAFRAWLLEEHASATEIWLGFARKGSGKTGMTTAEALDQALCFGWIDGIRKSNGAASYKTRYTPRRPRSIWSLINIRRLEELRALGLVEPAGLAAFAARTAERSGIYSSEQAEVLFEPADRAALEANVAAWAYWQAAPAGYRKTATWWVVSAKRPETRAKRLGDLIDCCSRGVRVPPLRRAGDAS